MIVKNFTDMKIEKHKLRLGLRGDVYIWNDHFIESLESHKRLIPGSTAKSIEEAYLERVEYERACEEIRRIQALEHQEVDNG